MLRAIILSFIFLSLTSCGSSSRQTTQLASTLKTRITINSRRSLPSGFLIYAWVNEPHFSALKNRQASDADFVKLIEALQIQRFDPDRKSFDLDLSSDAKTGGLVTVIQSKGDDAISALWGHANETQFVAWSQPSIPGQPISLDVESGKPPSERQEHCLGENRNLIILESPEVAGQIGNDTRRRLCVMLPDAYHRNDSSSYPVVFLLPGYGGNDTRYRHLAELNEDVILVGIDGQTKFGATYFHNTTFAGAWETFIDRVTQTIDARYRTNGKRGLLGHSTGGYNAISLLLRRGDLFHAAAASSPDDLDFDTGLLDANGRANQLWRKWAHIENTLGSSGQITSYAVQFSDLTQKGDIAIPFDTESGQVDQKIWNAWQKNEPLFMLNAMSESQQKQLVDRLFISVGRNDAFGLFEPAEVFHKRLDQLRINHDWQPTDDNHFTGSKERREAGLRFLIHALN